MSDDIHARAFAAATAGRPDEGAPITEDERWAWLEEQCRRSPTGISFDQVPGGYRFMRRHFISEQRLTLRGAVDNCIRLGRRLA